MSIIHVIINIIYLNIFTMYKLTLHHRYLLISFIKKNMVKIYAY